MRPATAALAVASLLASTDARAASPDPTLAALISAGATLLPIGVTTGLWLGGRGTDEGIRFDLGLAFLGVGSIVGPSTGQIYAGAVSEAWVSFVLRAITGTVMVTGAGLWLRGSSVDARNAGQALAYIGGVPTVLLAGWDVYDSYQSAVRARRRRGHSVIEVPVPEIGAFSLCSALIATRACEIEAVRRARADQWAAPAGGAGASS